MTLSHAATVRCCETEAGDLTTWVFSFMKTLCKSLSLWTGWVKPVPVTAKHGGEGVGVHCRGDKHWGPVLEARQYCYCSTNLPRKHWLRFAIVVGKCRFGPVAISSSALSVTIIGNSSAVRSLGLCLGAGESVPPTSGALVALAPHCREEFSPKPWWGIHRQRDRSILLKLLLCDQVWTQHIQQKPMKYAALKNKTKKKSLFQINHHLSRLKRTVKKYNPSVLGSQIFSASSWATPARKHFCGHLLFVSQLTVITEEVDLES